MLADKFRMPGDRARAIRAEHDLEPLEPYVNIRTPWRSRHLCGRVVSPTLGNISQDYGVCHYCNSAFPHDGPAYLYLAADAEALKVGIANPGGNRIAAHTSGGWRLRWKILLSSGNAAYALEQAVIAWWRTELRAAAVYTGNGAPAKQCPGVR